MVGPERAKIICDNRPFASWEEVERLEGIGKDMVDDLMSGGAQIGSDQ
ncbi:hypothetical protein [Chelativorans sp. YIM 93263]|nr:hypothetical protein [Chelativorans sp. YIM 93263]